jgi:23S rRNA pseudouridine1911/1915/1917 synthase
MLSLSPFTVIAAEAEHTLAKVLRSRLHLHQPSWNQVRAFIEQRHVTINGEVCTDSARRVHESEQITLHAKPHKPPQNSTRETLVLRHLDDHVVVVEKPSGINSVRHPAELEWSEDRRELDPTLQDVTQWAIATQLNRPARSLPPLRIVHRLDKETSGLLMFARSVLAERELGLQFRKHTVVRKYLAVVGGFLSAQTIRTTLVRDRGDGRRGSSTQPNKTGKVAITHVTVLERFAQHSLLSCQLETGRTHQIRIHLSEAGHPICGEKVYVKTSHGQPIPVAPAPRLALHAAELGFTHPVSQDNLRWEMALPKDLQSFLKSIRGV